MSTSGRTFKFVESYYSSLDCPRSLACYLMFKFNEHEQLAKLECNPMDYNSFEAFRHAYLATSFLSKATFLKTKIDKKAVAIEKFLDSEQACREINHRGYHWTHVKTGSSEWLHNAIIRKIGFILKDFSPDEMVDSANWGPGISLDVLNPDTSATNKFRKDTGTTRPLHDLMGHLYAVVYPQWDLSIPKFHAGNKIVTVPKNSKTDRTIAIEPGLNLWFQKAIGTMIRRRLLRVGLNLNTQERNQKLSRLGSKFSSLATVDFKSASDTIATSTVEALLPPQWFTVMDILRSRYGLIDRKLIKYEKFSSMGNGFTFELETLIFYAIALSVCEYLQIDDSEVSVYGDDVIIPTAAYDLFTSTCKFYGFTTNHQKSFSDGWFRESCGAHWWEGKNCKPIFLKDPLLDPTSVIKTANSLRRLSHDPINGFCDARFQRSWVLLYQMVKKKFFISDGYGDGGFIVNFDEASPIKAKHCIEGYFTRHLTAIPVKYSSDDAALLLARLWYRSTDLGLGNWTYLRGRVKILQKRLFIRRWANLGPWL